MDVLLEVLLKVVLPIGGMILVGLASWALLELASWLRKKKLFEVPATLEARGIALIEQAVAYGEVVAARNLEKLGEKIPSKLKMESAKEFFIEHAEKPLSDWAETKVENAIETHLKIKERTTPVVAAGVIVTQTAEGKMIDG